MIKKATLNAKLVDFNFDSLEPSEILLGMRNVTLEIQCDSDTLDALVKFITVRCKTPEDNRICGIPVEIRTRRTTWNDIAKESLKDQSASDIKETC